MNAIRIAQGFTAVIIAWAFIAAIDQGVDFWSTPDQRGQHFFDAGKYSEAANEFADPFRRAAALAEGRDFKSASALYATLPGPDAAFNHANALVMQGEYDTAIARYDRALEMRPDWTAALENRAIAALRSERLKEDPGIGTEGGLEADEIVFDLDSSKNAEASEVTSDGGAASDDELRQAWLRQVQTTPRDFLKSKFAYQEAMRSRTDIENEAQE